jgi:TAT (twin-arginine translocation) pathway signal sequence.
MKQKITRRQMIKGMAGIGTMVALPGCSTDGRTERESGRNAILRENSQPGTRNWMLTRTQVEKTSKYRSPDIEGFCSRTSVRAGETVEIFVSTSSKSEVGLEIYRMGYYGGAGGRLVHELGAAENCAST